MSTRAKIVAKVGDAYKGVLLAYDGYPQHAGRILRENYKTQEKVEALLALGYLEDLGKEPIHEANAKWRVGELPYCKVAEIDDEDALDYGVSEGATLRDCCMDLDYADYVYYWDGKRWMIDHEDPMGEPTWVPLAKLNLQSRS